MKGGSQNSWEKDWGGSNLVGWGWERRVVAEVVVVVVVGRSEVGLASEARQVPAWIRTRLMTRPEPQNQTPAEK